ncbi:hypothetical protein HUA74_44680 [Myxococcus sp. CA051A]|uniref:hypothetical protein n=1 Tax=Myxococcus sp. CA051A TaxID=2741739 RepID=UPI00157A4E79|nr:hypothetical protein [Myxococcus sp. CA051A]NTX67761.1 hypothetical protein [Myxococcus sp. CA051A]
MLTLVQEVVCDERIEDQARLFVFELYGELMWTVGPVPHHEAFAHDLQMPDYLAETAKSGALAWSDFDVRSHEMFMPLMRAYVEQKGDRWEDFAAALWRAWLGSEAPLSLWKRRDAPDWVLDWYAFIPPEAILDARLKRALESNVMPFGHFNDAQWMAFLEYWKREPHRQGFYDEEPWRHMPQDFIRQAIAEGIIKPYQGRALHAIWWVATNVVREELYPPVSGKMSPRLTRRADDALGASAGG